MKYTVSYRCNICEEDSSLPESTPVEMPISLLCGNPMGCPKDISHTFWIEIKEVEDDA